MVTTAQEAAGALANTVRAQQKFISNVLTDKPAKIYRLDDYDTIRGVVFDNVKDAVTKRFPLYNDRYSLAVENVEYDDPDFYDVDEQKRAIVEGKSLSRRLRGEWVLRDANDKVISRTKRMTLMRVPYMTERGTFIRNGKEFGFSNIMRLQPGTYTKSKDGEASAQFNIQQGSGQGFNMMLNSRTGVFTIKRGTVNAPAYTVLRDMGVSDDDMKASWGAELFEKNKSAGTGNKARASADRIYNM